MDMSKKNKELTLDSYKLKVNPFRLTPLSANDSNLVWAGFVDIKKKFENRIRKAIMIPNSSIILNWGEYGSGKTHALRYFSKDDVLKSIAGEKTIPYFIALDFPQSKKPIFDIYKSIIDKIDFRKLQSDFKEVFAIEDESIYKISKNIMINDIFKFIIKNENISDIKRYLYGTLSSSELKKLELERAISETDYIEVISIIFHALTVNKKHHSCVILWIDEFEDIAIQSMSNINLINNFIRQLIDSVSDNLLIMINLTQSAMMRSEDLGEYLIEAVKSRIKERINFEIPNKEEVENYLDELLNNSNIRYGERNEANIYMPFSSEVVDAVITTLRDQPLRRINEAFSLLLETAMFEGVESIDMDFYNNKSDIIGWK